MSKPKSELFHGTSGTKQPKSGVDTNNASSGKVNKYHHIFDKPQHKLQKYLETFNNDQEAAFNKLNEEYNNYIRDHNSPDGYLEIKLNINDCKITIRGVVIDGVGNIGTTFGEDD